MWRMLVRHWRGQYSLARAFWLNGVLGWHAALVSGVVLAIVNPDDESPAAKFVSVLSLLPLIILIWALVGIWRSATNARRRGSRFWPLATQLWLLIIVTFLLLLGVSFQLDPPDL